MSYTHAKLGTTHRLMLIDMLAEPEPRELESNLALAMKRRSHIRVAREETIERIVPVPLSDGTIKNLPMLRRATFWELTRAGQNVARQLTKIKDRHDAARELVRAGVEGEFPIGSEVVIVYTDKGGQAYRADDVPDGARIIARGCVESVGLDRGRPDVRVRVAEVTPVTVVEEAP